MNDMVAGQDMGQAAVTAPQAAVTEIEPDARYRRARRAWDERFAFHAQSAQQWRMLGLAGVVFGMFGIGYGLWVDGLAEYKPFPVLIDDLGRTEAVLDVATVSEWPPAVIKREMSDFVSNLRSVPADKEVLVKNMRRVLAFTTSGDPADTMIKEMGRSKTLSPFRIAESHTRSVEIINVNFVGGNSWLVEWRETTRNRSNGKISGIGRYKGTYVLKPAARLSPEIITVNPLGVTVEHFDIQKLN
jgi:type IV secretory pathway TrbF-like protein